VTRPTKNHPCDRCGIPTRAKDRLCASCKPTRGAPPAPVDPIGLGDGEWRIDLRRRVMVWHPAPPTEPEPPPLVSHNTERGYQWHRYWRVDWPLPSDDPCGCKAAHAAHEALRKATGRRARSTREAAA
jgi:hypothetical protein